MRIVLPLLLAGILAGCAGTPAVAPVADPEQAWRQHHAVLTGLEQWQISGRIAIQTEDEGWHASLDWRQQGDSFDILITGPLGSGTVRLQGDGRHVTLTQGSEAPLIDADPELLLYRQMGWRLPVNALRYWVLGLPAPGAARRELTPQGMLGKLQQAGWTIEFRDYARHGALLLPGRIFVSNHRARVRLVVDRWELPA